MKHLRNSLNANQSIPVEIPIEFGTFLICDEGAAEHRLPQQTVTAIQFDLVAEVTNILFSSTLANCNSHPISFIAEVTNLLFEPFAYNPDNLVLNSDPDNWFRPFVQEADAMIDEIHSASCYQDYVKNVLVCHGRH